MYLYLYISFIFFSQRAKKKKMAVSQEQEFLLWLCIFVPSFIGTFMSFSVLYTLRSIPGLKKKSYFTLILNSSTADFLNNFVYYVPGYVLNTFWCKVQGFFNTYLGLCTIFWPFCLMISMIVMIDMKTSDAQWYPLYRAIGWGLPFLLSMIPLFTNMYGDANAFCFLKNTPNDPENGLHWRLWIFYIPLWLVIISIIAMYFYLYRYVKEATGLLHMTGTRSKSSNSTMSSRDTTLSVLREGTFDSSFSEMESNEPKASVSSRIIQMLSPRRVERKTISDTDGSVDGQMNEAVEIQNKINVLKAISRLRYYPLTLILSYTFATVRRLYTIEGGSDGPYWLSILHSLFQNLPAILNPIIFYTTPKARKEIKAYWKIEYDTFEKLINLFWTCFSPNVQEEKENLGEKSPKSSNSSNISNKHYTDRQYNSSDSDDDILQDLEEFERRESVELENQNSL